jgi:hypothetical protein
MNKYLYNLPLRDILRQINMTDLYKIMNSPELRKIVFSSANLNELVSRIALNCIDDLEKKMDTNLFYELLGEYFEPKGFSESLVQEQEVYQTVMKEFYKYLFEFEYFDDELVSELQNMKEENVDFETIKDFLSNWQQSYAELSQLFMVTEQKLDYIHAEYVKEFKNYLFEGKNSYQNVKEYLDVVNDYVDQYVDNEEISYEFQECVRKIEKIKTLFEKKTTNQFEKSRRMF